MDIANQTLYIKNINDKVNRHEIKRLLYHLFCTYGYILEIQNSKTGKLRGQAFIAYDTHESAAIALRDLQGFVFLGKPLKIEFAKEKSHIFQKIEGTFVYPRLLRASLFKNPPIKS